MRDIPDTPPAIVRQTEDPAAIGKRVTDREHQAGRNNLQHAKEQGDDLLKVKPQIGHGNWLRWLATNVPFSQQTASDYMRVATEYVKLPVAGNLTVQEAIAIIRESKSETNGEEAEDDIEYLNREDPEPDLFTPEPPPAKPFKNGAIKPSPSGLDPDAECEKGDAYDAPLEEEDPAPTPEPAVTSPQDAATLTRVEVAQKGIKALGQVMRALGDLKLSDSFRDLLQKVKDAFLKHTGGRS